MSVAQDTSTCAAGTVRVGGFSYPIDVDGWQSFVTPGFSKAFCIPTPGGSGVTINSTVGNTALSSAGGYALTGDLTNAGNDAWATKSMVGFGGGNVATQFGGSLCASIGSLAASKRSCAVAIANVDVNHNPNGSLSPRGTTVGAAQSGVLSSNTPNTQ